MISPLSPSCPATTAPLQYTKIANTCNNNITTYLLWETVNTCKRIRWPFRYFETVKRSIIRYDWRHYRLPRVSSPSMRKINCTILTYAKNYRRLVNVVRGNTHFLCQARPKIRVRFRKKRSYFSFLNWWNETTAKNHEFQLDWLTCRFFLLPIFIDAWVYIRLERSAYFVYSDKTRLLLPYHPLHSVIWEYSRMIYQRWVVVRHFTSTTLLFTLEIMYKFVFIFWKNIAADKEWTNFDCICWFCFLIRRKGFPAVLKSRCVNTRRCGVNAHHWPSNFDLFLRREP